MFEKIFIEINGTKQGMFLQGEDAKNPVLLFLHGGPGSPEIAFTQKYPSGLEKLFTVCWWEQRGSGISYNSHIVPQEMTLEQMAADTVAVTNYLRERFGVEKIYIMGHSWGTLLGVLTVKEHPQLFHAYMGVGQVARQDKSERLAYTYMLREFGNLNNKKMVKKLQQYPISNCEKIPMRYMRIRSSAMNKLGIGVMRRMKSMMDCVAVILAYKGYTLGEKLRFVRGNGFSLKCLWDNVVEMDLIKDVSSMELPVYLFHGKYDYQVSYVIAKDFFKSLDAPIKGFYTFENSAHSPCFEEPEKMCNIICTDVLHKQVVLSDKV